jgi:hypothetical protein
MTRGNTVDFMVYKPGETALRRALALPFVATWHGELVLSKAVIQVKAHVRNGKAVMQHERNILTSGEKKDMVTALAHKLKGGGKGHIALAGPQAHHAARAIAKHTGKAVHVTQAKGGGYHVSHHAPAGKSHMTVTAKATTVHHPEHGSVEVTHAEARHTLRKADRQAKAPKAKADKPEVDKAKQHGMEEVYKATKNGPTFGTVDPHTIETDAESYQFKSGGDEHGVTDRLKAVKKWDSIAGQAPVMLHRTKEGKMYVVDGHQRTGLARRLKSEGKDVPHLNAVVFDEADGYTVGEMRRIGGLLNIQQGTGTSLDIAKVLREPRSDGSRGITDEEREAMPAGKDDLFKDGEALSNLGDEAFTYATNGKLSSDGAKNAAFAAIVARTITDPKDQLAAMKLIHEDPPQGRTECQDMVNEIKADGFQEVEQLGLFGTAFLDQTQSLHKPMAKIIGGVRRALQSEKNALGNAVRNKARLESKGSSIDTEQAKAGHEHADALGQLMHLFSDKEGPVRAALKEAAKGVQGGETSDKRAIGRVLEALEGEFAKLKAGGDGTQSDGGSGGKAGPDLFGDFGQKDNMMFGGKGADPAPTPEPKIHKYGMQMRPAGLGAIPKGHIGTAPNEHFRHGEVHYDRELTPDEIKSFELDHVTGQGKSQKREDAKTEHTLMGTSLEHIGEYLDETLDMAKDDHPPAAVKEAIAHLRERRPDLRARLDAWEAKQAPQDMVAASPPAPRLPQALPKTDDAGEEKHARMAKAMVLELEHHGKKAHGHGEHTTHTRGFIDYRGDDEDEAGGEAGESTKTEGGGDAD